MNRVLATFALLACLSLPTKAGLGTDLRTWFQHFKEGLSESSLTAERQKTDLTSVAAVRGAKQGTAELDKPVWKSPSEARRARALKKQKAELSAAIDLVLQGNLADGDTKLAAFEKSYPDSPYLADAHQARRKIKQAQQP